LEEHLRVGNVTKGAVRKQTFKNVIEQLDFQEYGKISIVIFVTCTPHRIEIDVSQSGCSASCVCSIHLGLNEMKLHTAMINKTFLIISM